MTFIKGEKKPPFSLEHRRKLAEAQRNRPVLDSTREKQRARVGEKSGAWKGGISKDHKHYHRIYRNRKLNAEGSHTNKEWENLKAQYNWTCPCCGRKEPEIKLAGDHIIPLSKGGSDNIENIQPLCKSCNSKKKNIHSTKYEPK
jgi:5-methylcytosine-specific restriction endonuclease McrA